MLQRAASNAYSWWWASHVRTKQTKWLEQSLEDMGYKVEAVLALITEGGDSFAKRAEMYYKHRPDIINFIEEAYKAYRSLAERFDHLSKELQNANSTLASAFPDQFPYPMDDDDEYGSPRMPPRKIQIEIANPNAPKAPQNFPTRNIKALMALTQTKKNNSKSGPKSGDNVNKLPKSGLTKPEAVSEVDKLQKQILTLQTEKEFAKSTYESCYAKFFNIEEEITETQEKISKLQDEFGIAQAIDDNEARTLMAEAAIKSCQDTLAQLQEKQGKAAEEAKAERQRIKTARDKLRSLLPQDNASEGGSSFLAEENWTGFDDAAESSTDSNAIKMLREKVKKHFDVGATTSLTVSEMAEKIDKLVNKVITLESAASSQTALIHRLRSETDDLQSQIKNLEDDKEGLVEGKSTLKDKVNAIENKLKGLRDLDRSFQKQNCSLETHFSEAKSNLDSVSKRLPDVKPDEDLEDSSKSQESEGLKAGQDVKPKVVKPKKEKAKSTTVLTQQPGNEPVSIPEGESAIPKDVPQGQARNEEGEPDWQHLFTNGMEEKEKVLLAEYTSTLRNYKETKKRLGEMEKKNQDDLSEIQAQLREMKSHNVKKDEEIQILRQKLSVLQKRLDECKNLKEREVKKEDPPAPPANAEDIALPVYEREISPVEQKLRGDIDELLEENLDFWMRFSASYGQIQTFQTRVQDLFSDLAKLQDKDKKEDSCDGALKSETRPLHKHLREIETELTVWLEQSEKLKEELQRRFSQLCNIQDEINHALNAGAEDDDMIFTSFQAAKFQGEVANMQQENNKVADEIQAGMDHITSLQLEVEQTISRLNDELGYIGSISKKDDQAPSDNRARVPLKSFIFGVNEKKKKSSIFSCIHPAMHRRYQNLK